MSIVLTIFVIVALTFGIAIALFKMRHDEWSQKRRYYASNRQEFNEPKPKLEWVKPVIFGAVANVVYVMAECITIVPAGHVGVQVTLGEVSQSTLSEGLHFVNPMSSVRNIEVRMVTAKLPASSAGTKDLQQVHTEIVLNYRLDGSKAAHIYKDFGLDLETRVILPSLSEAFKAVTAHYTSEELITKRDEVSTKIRDEVAVKLAKYSVGVNDISLVNFGFSAEYQRAIEAKVIATQEKLKAEQDLARIEVEAKQTIAKAEGRAKAIQIETQAINSQGGASYVQLKAIEKWDGKLPTTNAGSTIPFINVK
jgi:regulator of protease activity HflC (stomatin/prohibitin superfamily)